MKVSNSTFVLTQFFLGVLLFVYPCSIAHSSEWKQWDTFHHTFMSEDGRIVDLNSPKMITTSEGQAYSLFFALVAGDRENFKLLLKWTDNNLADGNLDKRLPAWLWGKSDEGTWQVLDDNAASDVDIWLAYTLLEAGRLWDRPEYAKLGKKLSDLILEQEVVNIPGLGKTLLPAPFGFNSTNNVWRLNPSYSPLQLLVYLAGSDKRWDEVIKSSDRVIRESASVGFSPDWVEYRSGQGFTGDPKTKNIGSYNAIRVYLWAGMLHKDNTYRPMLLKQFAPMIQFIEERGFVPEKVDTADGSTENTGPVGFTAAMLPFLQASNSTRGLISQLSHLIEKPLSSVPDSYYTQVLGLFGLGWYQKRYCFASNGQLVFNEKCR